MPTNTSVRKNILDFIPQQKPFRFIDRILDVNENSICGEYTYREDEYFYDGHFPDFRVTPGAILIETMAQIGLLGLGLFITSPAEKPDRVFLTSSDVEFRNYILPGEKVKVEAKKKYFRLNKLKCEVSMYHEKKGLICRGILAGMFIKD